MARIVRCAGILVVAIVTLLGAPHLVSSGKWDHFWQHISHSPVVL